MMRASRLNSAIMAALLALGGSFCGGAWAQQAAPGAADAPPADSGPPAPAAVGSPNADKAPMQAQDLSYLVKDSSRPAAADVSRDAATSDYRFNKNGVNCSLYPSRCRGQNY